MMTASELERALHQFTGSTTFVRHGLARNVRMTEGAVFLQEKAEAYWLGDAIVSYLTSERVREEAFQVWTLHTALANSKAVLTMTDGNTNKVVVQQAIAYTDFPLAETSMWLVQEGDEWVLMVPGEY